jgi:hypothetical protein
MLLKKDDFVKFKSRNLKIVILFGKALTPSILKILFFYLEIKLKICI